MVIVVFESFRVVECRVIVFQDNGFSFWSVPQTISCWGQLSFPDCSGPFSTSISLILGLDCHGAGFFVGCQLLAGWLKGVVSHLLSAALSPGFPHLRHNRSLIRFWNSSLDMLNLGRFLVAFRSIGSP